MQAFRLALIALFLTSAFSASGSRAQDGATREVEPVRFALIIGNAEKYSGLLAPLGSPCNDAKEMQKSLVADGFNRNDVTIECNVSTDRMRGLLYKFMEKVLNTKRALGIFYFSGHGAQVGGRNYIFGVDADLDPSREIATYKQNRNAPLFLSSAIELGELARLNRIWGKAVVVLVDACRNNALVDEMLAKGISNDQVSYPTRSTDIDGVLYGFATSSGAPAPSGGLTRLSPYTEQLAKNVVAFADKSIDELIIATKVAVQKKSRGRQTPDRAGSLIVPPRFCMRGCPSPLDAFKSWDDELSTRDGYFEPYKPKTKYAALLDSLDREAFVEKSNLSEGGGPSVQLGGAARVAQVASNPDPNGLRKMRFDVFWCQGDKEQDERRERANLLAKSARGLRGVLNDYTVGEVTVKSLPSRINNLQQYRLSRDVAFFDEGRDEERSWAEALAKVAGMPLEIASTSRKSPDYISVFVCQGADPNRVAPRVYIQVATMGQREPAASLVRRLQNGLKAVDVETGVEVVKSPPRATEVRFFYEAQSGDAERVASIVRDITKGPALVRRISGFEARLKGSPVIEVWLPASANIQAP